MERTKRKYRFSIRRKLVVFTTILAIITYSTSAFFIYVLHDLFFTAINKSVFTIITLLLGIIWSGILAYIASGFVIKPLHRLEQAAIKAASGQINEDVPLSRSDDEIRSLGIAFNEMLQSLRTIVQNIEDNFSRTNEKVVEITNASLVAAERSKDIAHTIEEISKGANDSAVSMQTAAESVDDVLRIANQVQQKANQSEQLVKEMVTTLHKSREVISSLVGGIEQLARNNQTSLVAVQRLEQHAKEVENIISLVGDIAGQTNLLALNASIEAARAGEHGKGFAVVAEEVRKLADESAKAVQGISELIQNIQKEVAHVVAQIHEQVKAANEEAAKGADTNDAIAEMTQSIHEVVRSVQEIAELVKEQMTHIEKAAIQSQEVAAIAEETSAGATEVTAATQEQTSVIQHVNELAEELAEQAKKLKETIDQIGAK
ncbi:methyl-accepting chemotaxis protein [Parageobacillus thermoglucosidasius]|uniref:Methyl-accepting chemotaxis protein n=1 Tax=Parageobacillus thermoglucosidasius TaxID=1426 RepID=A0AB38QZF9_PARTM|nr:methyl-accepting chemotaxis protein [Parageobacillus thermoglucosidasius]UOE76485.1 methyl-accepting chemotaxis protein [Parageobacillus thermoglucosidasius]GCD84477.1 methyl-accepting chemotaxis protein [Parageobacillus thermoglucosidasius]